MRQDDDFLSRNSVLEPVASGAVPDLFVTFRTGDEDGSATMIGRELARRFGAARVLVGDPSLAAAERVAAVPTVSVLLPVIGPRWLAHADDHGHNALDVQHDVIRNEIVAAFDADVPVVPILVERAERLRVEDLPRVLARLADCRYLRVDTRTAQRDLRELGDRLLDLVPDLTDADYSEPETITPPIKTDIPPTATTTVGDIHGNVSTGGYQFNGEIRNVDHIGDTYGGADRR